MEMTGTMPELSADMDQESQEMRAIDPNMTTGLSDSMMGEDSQVWQFFLNRFKFVPKLSKQIGHR